MTLDKAADLIDNMLSGKDTYFNIQNKAALTLASRSLRAWKLLKEEVVDADCPLLTCDIIGMIDKNLGKVGGEHD